jgi:hypothetical protein
MRNVYEILVGKPEDKTLLKINRRRMQDNIKLDLTAIGCESVDWIHQAHDTDR